MKVPAWPVVQLPAAPQSAPESAPERKRFGVSKQTLPNSDVVIRFRYKRLMLGWRFTSDEYWRFEREIEGTCGALLFAPYALALVAVVVFVLVGVVTLIGLFIQAVK